ncbi:hypothetical protein ACIBHX_50590 [Nonomuraea sp. NPDC050536]|uniref:hypothetical protein n=1 Tax=Nonomuraea sp. NPDC050536 TaxID=3364366 RepID=UPI0037CA0709
MVLVRHRTDQDFVFAGMVGEPKAQLRVQIGLTRRIGQAQERDHRAELVEPVGEFLPTQLLTPSRRLPQGRLGTEFLALLLLNPRGHDRRIRAGFQGRAVLGQLAVALGDLAPGRRRLV